MRKTLILALAAGLLWLTLRADKRTPFTAKPNVTTDLALVPHKTTSETARLSVENPIRTFQSLSEKAVLTEVETQTLTSLYGSEEVLGRVRDQLISIPPAFTRDEEKERFAAISFLEKASLSVPVESKELVISTIENIIEAPNLSSDLPLSVRKSIAGDKQELFIILTNFSSTRAEQLLGRLDNPKVRALLKTIAAPG